MHATRADQLHIFTHATRAEMGRAAGLHAARVLRETLRERGEARIILASAPSQDEMLGTLIAEDVDWSRVTIFHMDEYLGLPAQHPQTFRAYQRACVLQHIQPAAFHGIAGERDDAAAVCEEYARLLAAAPIDLCCLGIGENGHLAFNDPPVADFADPLAVKVVQLDHACRQQQVNDGCFPTLNAVPRAAITLTLPALFAARTLLCTVPGPRKAAAVLATVRGVITTACPASILRRHADATLYLDAAAAAAL